METTHIYVAHSCSIQSYKQHPLPQDKLTDTPEHKTPKYREEKKQELVKTIHM